MKPLSLFKCTITSIVFLRVETGKLIGFIRHTHRKGCGTMDFILNFFIIALFIFPFITLIHESGHAFFLKLFGGAINEFTIGMGEAVWKKNRFIVRKAYFAGGWVIPRNLDLLSKYQKIIYFLGGVIFNLLSALVLDSITGYEFGTFRNYIDSFIFVSYLNVLINLIPFVSINGRSDGKQIIGVLKDA